MVSCRDMAADTREQKLSRFSTAVYDFLREHIDTIDVETMSGSDFSTLLDLKKAVDVAVAEGIVRWHGGRMS